jgi:hypothetical protein
MPGAYTGGYCKDVEVLDVGTHRGDDYTLADLRDIERNFRMAVGLVDPPVVIGHEERQPLVDGLAENTGEPAVGWITALRVERRKGADGKVRPVLLADLHHVHPEIAALINARAYRKVSPEIYGEDGYPEDAPPAWHGKALRRLALLGGQLPHIKTLRDLPAVRFGEAPKDGHRRATLRRAGRRRTADGKGWAVFSEVTPMDRATLEDQLKSLPQGAWSDAMIEAAKPLSDDDFMALANAALAQAAGADTGAATDTGAGAAATGMVEWPPEAPSRDEVIAQLVAAGQDQATLDAMSDEELLALYQQKKGDTGAAPMSETPKKGARTFAEQLKRAVLADVRKELADVKRDIDSVKGKAAFLANDTARRRLAERGGAVKAYCERWLRDGYVLPAEVDPASKTPNLHHRLMNADGTRVKKYGEGLALSDFDAAVAEIESRGPGWARRNTRELVPDPEKGADPFGEKVKKYYETRLERLKRN